MNIKKLILSLVVFYLSIIAFLFLFQRNLQYHPNPKIADLSSYNMQGFVEEKFLTADKVKILAWYRAPKNNEKTILFFHGNAGNLGNRAEKIKEFSNHGFGVLAASYRGYSGSEGSPSEKGLVQDAQAAFKFLLDKGILPQDVILYGESLGSGVATQLASKFDFFAVILESPFASIASVAQKKYWFAPVNLMLKDKFDSANFAPKISAPVLIIHGTEDKVVSIDEGKKLYHSITAPKKFIEVAGIGHIAFGNEFLITEIEKFLKETRNVGEKKP